MTTPTAQQLWDQTDQYRREGGPGMPEGMEWSDTWDEFSIWCDDPSEGVRGPMLPGVEKSAAILRDHGRTWLETEGWTVTTTDTFKLVPDMDAREHLWDVRYQCEITLQDVSGETTTYKAEGPTMLAAINAAIGAVLDAIKGEHQ